MEKCLPVDVRKLLNEERTDNLSFIMFLTEKIYGRTQVRKCANGNKKWNYTKKEYETSLTAYIKEIMIIS